MASIPLSQWAETWRRVLGDGNKILRTKFSNDFFRKQKFHFIAQNFWWRFLVVNSILSVSTVWNLTIFLTKNLYFRTKNSSLRLFFSQFVLCLISNNSTSRNIGGTDALAVPISNFGGTVPPVPPKSPPMTKSQEIYMYMLKSQNDVLSDS